MINKNKLGLGILLSTLILLILVPLIKSFSANNTEYGITVGYEGAGGGTGEDDDYSLRFTLSYHPLSPYASSDGYLSELGYIHMINTRPRIKGVNVTPRPVYFGNIVMCKANVTDIDSDDILTVKFNITSPSNINYNSTGVADIDIWYSDFVPINESGNWNCTITVYDGYDYSISSINFTPIEKVGAISTVIGDMPFYSLTVNPLNQSNQSCLAELKGGEACNQSWNVNATGYLETKWLFYVIYNSSYSNALTSKINITIVGNATPILTTPTIAPSLAYTNDTLSCSFLIFDWDTEELTVNVTWYLNNTINQTEQLNCTERQRCYTNNNITPSSTTKLENWTCSVNAYDNNSWSGWKNSSRSIILNRAPDTPVLLYPETDKYFAINSSLVNWTVIEIDKDSMTCYVYGQNTTAPSNIINVTSDVTNGSYHSYNWSKLSDSVYYWKVRCDDATENSSFSETRYFTIDTTPTAIQLILPNNKTGDNDANLSFSYNVTETNNVTNCSLIINGLINITNNSIDKSTTNYFYMYEVPVAQYNWSINCSDNTGNIGESNERLLAVILTTKYDKAMNFSSVNVFNITNLFLENIKYGKMNFTNTSDLSDGADLNKHGNVSFNWLELNSSAVKELNMSTTLLLRNLTFTNPRILRDISSVCLDTICSINDYTDGNLSFNVTRWTVYSAEETPVPPVVVERAAEGTGEGTGQVITSIRRFSVDKDVLRVELKQGETKKETLVITNEGDTVLKFNIKPIGLEQMILVMDDKFTLLPRESKEVTIYFSAREEQLIKIYTGKLLITANYQMKLVAVIVDVIKKVPLFDVNVKVHNTTKKILKGEDVEADITMINVGDPKEVDIVLHYAVRDLDGNTINFKEETMAIREKLSITRRLRLPEDINYGTYLFYAEVRYGKEKAVSTDVFEVVEEKPVVIVERYTRLRDFRNLILFILLCLLLVMMAYKPSKKLIYKLRFMGLKKEALSLNERKLEIERKFKQIKSIEKGISIERFNTLLLSIISNIKENRVDEETINKYNKLVNIYNKLRLSKINREDKLELYRRVVWIRKYLERYVE